MNIVSLLYFLCTASQAEDLPGNIDLPSETDPQSAPAEVQQPEITYENIKPEWTSRKGLRFGYAYINKGDESGRLTNPSMFTMGFETQQTMKGGDWLDLLFTQNITIGGLEQSVVIPSVNALYIGLRSPVSPGPDVEVQAAIIPVDFAIPHAVKPTADSVRQR